MTADELRAVELREAFRGADPDAVEAALGRWAQRIERGERLDIGDLISPIRRRTRGYHYDDLADLVSQLILENT